MTRVIGFFFRRELSLLVVLWERIQQQTLVQGDIQTKLIKDVAYRTG